ncbi:MAG: exosortase/archaeosortase family protein [Planctomycetaceae bacterium]
MSQADKTTQGTQLPSQKSEDGVALAIFGCLLVALGVAFFRTFDDFMTEWNKDPQNAFGWIVPLFSLGLLYIWRDTLPKRSSNHRLAGALVVALGVAIQLVNRSFGGPDFINGCGFVVALGGAVLMAFGLSVFRWALPAVLYLLLMAPLPYGIQTFARRPLRRFGTLASAYVLQSLGFFASSLGNTIFVNDTQVGVAEACSGLRMLMVFVAICIAMALISNRPLWERAVIVVSAVPIALVANILRIVGTAAFASSSLSSEASTRLHDLMGFLMMPLGLALVGIEAWFLSRLLLVEKVMPVAAGTQRSRAAV